MNYYITYFYNIRFFTPDLIPVSTAIWDPVWYHNNSHNQNFCFIDKNGVLNGIREESLALPRGEHPQEMCQVNCPFRGSYPHCAFLDAYANYLKTLNFDKLLAELNRVAIDAKKILNLLQEPSIVLLVHEKPTNPCSERFTLQQLFQQHDINLQEWVPQTNGIIF